MLGARFDRRPWRTQATPQTTVRIQVEDQTHPATAHFPASFEMADDIYLFKDFDHRGASLLLRLDASSLDLTKAGVILDGERFPVAWTRTHGQGRVFYTALGDWEETWKNPTRLESAVGCGFAGRTHVMAHFIAGLAQESIPHVQQRRRARWAANPYKRKAGQQVRLFHTRR